MEDVEIIGRPPQLEGTVCQALLCEQYWHGGELVTPANVIWVSAGAAWHRLTFDLGIVFWRSESEAPRDYEMPGLKAEARLDDLGARLGLAGSRILSCSTRPIARGSEVVFTFEGGRTVAFRNVDDMTTYVS